MAARYNWMESFGTFGGANADFLPVDEVFEPILTALDGNNVEVAIRVMQGYYLYKDKFTATVISDKAQAGNLEKPAGEKKTDQYFGEMEVYHNDVFAKLPIARATPDAMDVELEVKYQGCADGGICYPPVTKILTVSLPAATIGHPHWRPRLPLAGAPVSEQARLAQLISGSSMMLVLATFFGAGLLLAFTRHVCCQWCLSSPASSPAKAIRLRASRGFSLALTYVMGMAVVYTLAAGIAAAAVGIQLQAIFNQPWVLAVFSGLFVVLALSMFGLFNLQMPSSVQSRLSTRSAANRKVARILVPFVMGALSSLIVTACVAPPLVATLTVIGQTGDMVRGGSALFALSIGMGTPLLLVGASAGKLIPRAGPWMDAVKNAFGFMMLGLAIWMMSRVIPGEVTLALWAVLIFMIGCHSWRSDYRHARGTWRAETGQRIRTCWP